MQYLIILLQATQQPGNPMISSMVFMGAILLVFYFFMIRPQAKRQKEERVFRENLQKGDRVMTIGGMHGKIVSLDDATALLQVDDSTKIKMEKSALKAIPSTQTATKT